MNGLRARAQSRLCGTVLVIVIEQEPHGRNHLRYMDGVYLEEGDYEYEHHPPQAD